MTGIELDRLRRSYRAAFLRCMSGADERALHAGYEIGRSAVTGGLSLLDLAQTHHQVLLEVLQTTPPDDLERIARAASDFLVEVLATFDMTQRSLRRGTGDAGSGGTALPGWSGSQPEET